MAPAAFGQCRYCTPRPDNKSAASGALTMAANMIAQELGWYMIDIWARFTYEEFGN